MKNIVLTGFMGTGKTTVGRILAKKLGRRFLDMDFMIEEKENRRIADIFASEGEEYFRSVEKRIAADCGSRTNCVIATGGGAVLDSDNMRRLRENGVIINLYAPVDTVIMRTRGGARPLMKEQSRAQVEERMRQREIYYADNDFRVEIEGKSPLEIAEEIIAFYKNFI